MKPPLESITLAIAAAAGFVWASSGDQPNRNMSINPGLILSMSMGFFIVAAVLFKKVLWRAKEDKPTWGIKDLKSIAYSDLRTVSHRVIAGIAIASFVASVSVIGFWSGVVIKIYFWR
jgi:hypothetical protein